MGKRFCIFIAFASCLTVRDVVSSKQIENPLDLSREFHEVDQLEGSIGRITVKTFLSGENDEGYSRNSEPSNYSSPTSSRVRVVSFCDENLVEIEKSFNERALQKKQSHPQILTAEALAIYGAPSVKQEGEDKPLDPKVEATKPKAAKKMERRATSNLRRSDDVKPARSSRTKKEYFQRVGRAIQLYSDEKDGAGCCIIS